MKKLFIAIVMLLCSAFNSFAVLQEQDLPKTVAVLYTELQKTYQKQQMFMARYEDMNKQQHQQLIEVMQKSNQIALMLYSQQQTYTFDLAYACHEATDQYRDYKMSRQPHAKINSFFDVEINRYQNLISSLKALPPRIKDANDTLKPKPLSTAEKERMKKMIPKDTSFLLTMQGRQDRDSCIYYAEHILENLQTMKENIAQDNEHLQFVEKRLKQSNDYAEKRYQQLQQNIFTNGDDSYFTVLSQFPRYVMRATSEFTDKYRGKYTDRVKSGWSGRVVFGLVVIVTVFMAIATILGNVIVRFVMPRFIIKKDDKEEESKNSESKKKHTGKRLKFLKEEDFDKQKPCLVMAVGVIIFAITVMLAKSYLKLNFILMASDLLIEYAWMLGVILISLLIRLDASQIKKGFQLYTPALIMGFIIIVFRIVFISNTIINLVLTPLALFFAIWQLMSIRHCASSLHKSDTFYAWMSFAVMFFSFGAALFGYSLLAVQVFIWWFFQLTFIQTITCFFDLLEYYEDSVLVGRLLKSKDEKKKKEEAKLQKLNADKNTADAAEVKAEDDKTDEQKLKEIRAMRKAIKTEKAEGKYITLTWVFDLFQMCVVPVLAVLSVFFSILWAAELFNLTEFCRTIFFTNFVNVPDVIQLSIFKLVVVAAWFFVFKYIRYLIKSLYRYHCQQKNSPNATANISLVDNISGIVIWGTYFVFILVALQVPKSGISLVTAGLATGVGFAMKDLLENMFYGFSLMGGRVHVGDWVECDGVRGKVKSISPQSTQILTADGCVIAFLNSSLFNKNFKNLTGNDSYELLQVPVGVAYGTDVDLVRKVLSEAVGKLIRKDNEGNYNIKPTSKDEPIKVIMEDMADNSVNLKIVVYVNVPKKFWIVAEIKEVIYKTLNANNIEIPFPQRDIHIIKQD